MNKISSILKNKLKFYSVLMAILLVGSAITLTFNYENYYCENRDGEVLTLDSLKEDFAKIDRQTTVNVDTADGRRDTSTFSSWSVHFKPTFQVTVPVRPIRGANDKFLYSSLKGEPCMVEMQKVKLKVPFEKASPDFTLTNTLLSCATLPLLIWLLVIVLMVIRSVYKGEIFVSQIAKRLETAGWLLVAIWIVGNVTDYIHIQLLRDAVLMAYYDIYWQPTSINFVIFGLVLMILSQIILKGKDLKDEQELTI
jgi:hypothetical protein